MPPQAGRPLRRILLVEDEADIRVALKELLESTLERVEVVLAPDGAAGLAAMRARRPDLVVSDSKMPGMGGLEFLRAARAQAPDAPRILVTAFPDLDLALRSINEAAVERFLQKPLDPELVVSTVARLLDEQEARREAERALARGIREMGGRLPGKRAEADAG